MIRNACSALQRIEDLRFSTYRSQSIEMCIRDRDGTMKMKQQTLNALKGYVAMGNYTQEQFESIADSTANCLPDAIEAIAARRSK